MILLLPLFYVTASQSVDSDSILSNLCTNSATSNTLCTFCNENPNMCKPSLPIVSKLCNVEFKDDQRCTPVLAYCKLNNCTETDLPSSDQVSGMIYSICDQMPMMPGCKTCPAPESDGISRCDLWKTYRTLCMYIKPK